MEHDLELFSPILEILEIGVCNILYNPENIGNGYKQLPHILGILENVFFNFLISWKYWKYDFSNFSHPGNIGSYDPYSVLSWK